MGKKYILINTMEDYEEANGIRDKMSDDCIVLLNYMEDLFSVRNFLDKVNDKNTLHIIDWLAHEGEYLDEKYDGNFTQINKENENTNENTVVMNFLNDQYISDYFYHDEILRLVFVRNENGKGKKRLYLDTEGNVILKTRISWNEVKRQYYTYSYEFKLDGKIIKLNSEKEFIAFFLDHILLHENDEMIVYNGKYIETLVDYETNLQKIFYVTKLDPFNLLPLFEYSNSGIKILVKTMKIKNILLQKYHFPENVFITQNELKKINVLKKSLKTNVVGVLTDGISPKAGGLTGALYKRIKFLQKMHYSPFLLTFSNQNSEKLYKESVKIGRAVNNPVYNLWSFMRKRTAFFESNQINQEVFRVLKRELQNSSFTISITKKFDKKNTCIKFSYSKEKIYRFKGFSEDSIFLQETFQENVLQKREYFNEEGVKVRQTTLSNGKTEDTESFYYNGKLFLTTGRIFNKSKNRYVTTWYDLPTINGMKHFKAYYELQIYFMKRHFAYASTVLFVEHPAIYTAVSSWKTRHYINVVFHSTHLIYGTNNLKGAYDKVVANLGNTINQIIVLTKSAKSNLDTKVNKLQQSSIIIEPHTIEKKDIIVPFNNRPDFTVVSLGRLDKDKRVSHAIKAFSTVVKHIPQAKLIIYGEGPEKNNLLDLSKKLGIQNNVEFMGFTHKTDEAFQNATVHLFASKFEGFGLTLLESLSNGTPNIAYAVDYGPREFVKKEYLVEDGNIDKLSFKLLEVLEHPENKIERSMNAIEFSSKYTDNNYYDQLLTIVKTSFRN